MLFVPPEMPFWNGVDVATVTETVVGEIAMLMPVVGSVHEEDDVVVDVVEVVVVHVMAVLGVVGADLRHETRVNVPMNNAKIQKPLTAPLSFTSHMPIYCGSVATSLQRTQIISHRALRKAWFHLIRPPGAGHL